MAGASGSVDLPPETAPVAAQVIGWFVLGFAFYSCLFAVSGAMASRVEELQSTTTPLTFLVVGSFFAALAAGNDPSGPVARIATLLPPSAPWSCPSGRPRARSGREQWPRAWPSSWCPSPGSSPSPPGSTPVGRCT